MNSYIILYENGQPLLADYKIIHGKTGVEALNNHIPEDWLGIVKRVRANESDDFIIQKLVEKDGQAGRMLYRTGSRYGYKYHHPRIEREDRS